MNQERQQPQENEEDEADYLFHEFDFDFSKDPRASPSSGIQQQLKTHTDIVDENTKHRTKDQDNRTTPETEPISIAPPTPPLGSLLQLQQQQPAVADKTTILNARGHHLCINDVYQTAYSFRVRSDTMNMSKKHILIPSAQTAFT
jgi:hypothetical protein